MYSEHAKEPGLISRNWWLGRVILSRGYIMKEADESMRLDVGIGIL